MFTIANFSEIFVLKNIRDFDTRKTRRYQMRHWQGGDQSREIISQYDGHN